MTQAAEICLDCLDMGSLFGYDPASLGSAFLLPSIGDKLSRLPGYEMLPGLTYLGGIKDLRAQIANHTRILLRTGSPSRRIYCVFRPVRYQYIASV